MTLAYESLPQRPPRDRKRARVVTPGGGDGEVGPSAADASAAAAAVAGGGGDGAGPSGAPLAPAPGCTTHPGTDGAGGEPEKAGGSDEAGTSSSDGGGSGSEDGDDAGSDGDAPGKPAVRGRAFEYLDHTADIQIHSWGPTLQAAMAEAGLGLFHYMTPITGLAAVAERSYTATGHDLHSLLFAFLDELLFGFATDGFACASLEVTSLVRGDSGQGGEGGSGGGGGTSSTAAPRPWTLTALGRGEAFDRARHAAGTEVKAITYSAMRVEEEGEEEGGGGRAQVWVIVDI